MIIMGKLLTVYIDADKGYGDGWTDKKLAEDLSVPRVWVKEVREGVYGKGSAGNDEIEEALREGRLIVSDVRTLLVSADRMEAEAKKLTVMAAALRDRVDRVDRNLHTIEASLK